ncbi:hypothetical protein BRPE64_CCDS01600 [Caballeronia insecticola]|uniref:Uncharacterized protein n=1 Tax=Caballeronia insecticola TaxID=758793 RepID=R4WNR3_9BURK|nr:hypothetical protein BRPE64_CCDS01600 [Caballeronia insecticola]
MHDAPASQILNRRERLSGAYRKRSYPYRDFFVRVRRGGLYIECLPPLFHDIPA